MAQKLRKAKHLTEMSERQRMFCHKYLETFSSRKAAIAAGFPEEEALQIGRKLLAKESVINYIREVNELRFKEARVSVRRIVEEFAKIAFSDITDYIDYDGETLTVKDLIQVKNPEVIKSLKVKTLEVGGERYGQEVTIELHDKIKGLEALAKHLKMFSDGPASAPPSVLNAETVNLTIVHRPPLGIDNAAPADVVFPDAEDVEAEDLGSQD